EDAPVQLHPHDLSSSKLEPKKVKVDVREVAAPVHILAVDDLRLLRMQHQLAGREAVRNRTPECPRLLGALAMTDNIVRVPCEWDVRKRSLHPRVDRIVEKQVRQARADDPSLRRSRRARRDAAVLHLYRRLQPSLDVEQEPRTVRMMADCLEQKLPIDAVEEALNVEIEHPAVAPTALAS